MELTRHVWSKRYANFEGPYAQGTAAYVSQLILDHPDRDPATAAADAELAVDACCAALTPSTEAPQLPLG